MEIAPDQHSEQVIKQILSGVSTVVTDPCGTASATRMAAGSALSGLPLATPARRERGLRRGRIHSSTRT